MRRQALTRFVCLTRQLRIQYPGAMYPAQSSAQAHWARAERPGRTTGFFCSRYLGELQLESIWVRIYLRRTGLINTPFQRGVAAGGVGETASAVCSSCHFRPYRTKAMSGD